MKRIRYRGQVIELHRVPGSKRAWVGTIYWDHDRRPAPLGQCRNRRQAKRNAKDLVNIFLDGVSLMNELPLMLAEMGRDSMISTVSPFLSSVVRDTSLPFTFAPAQWLPTSVCTA